MLFLAALACALAPGFVVPAQNAPDSLTDFADGKGTLKPFTRLAARGLDSCAGLVWHDGAWWAHNDSGDGPYLYRSTSLDFTDAERLAVPGARNVDWEDICVLDGRLLICDVGDSHRRRDDITLYHVRYSRDESGKGYLVLDATYPVRWPGEPHDCEAAAVLDGKLHLVTKQRTEGFTALYRFETLKAGVPNTPELAAKLNLGDGTMITAADGDAAGGHLVLLGYTRVFVFAKDVLQGPPLFSTLIEAGQCEALCLRDGHLHIASVQRDVYLVRDYLKRRPQSMLPPRVQLSLPFEDSRFEPDGSGNAWKTGAGTLTLRGGAQADYLRWMIAGPRLLVAGSLAYEGAFTSSSERGSRMGSGLWLGVATSATEQLAGDERLFFIGDNGASGPDVWTLDVQKGIKLTPLTDVKAAGKAEAGRFTFEVSLPLTAVFGQGKLPARCLANAWGYGLNGKEEVSVAGSSFYSMLRPYTWADVTVRQ
jgi:hypothetical protein